MTEKLSKLHHDGHITDDEYDRLKKALNSLRVDEMYQLEMEQADQFIPLSVVQEIRQEISDKMAYPGYDIAISIGMKKALDILNDKIKEYME